MSELTVATWNVNSIRVRMPRVRDWLQRKNPDVLCMQETKVEDGAFPRAELESLGYRIETYGQKTYNGVAIASKLPPDNVTKGLPGDGDSGQRRMIAASIAGVDIINVYVPNGESPESEKFTYKLEWLDRLRAWLADTYKNDRPVLLCGDFNIAPEDRDVHDPEKWRGHVLFHPREHASLSKITKLGFHDALRAKTAEGGIYTWFDYRMGAFHRGWGLRIDLILVTAPLLSRLFEVIIDRDERKGEQPSDHAPVAAKFAM